MSNEPDVIREAKRLARQLSARASGQSLRTYTDRMAAEDAAAAKILATLAAHDASPAGEEMHPDAIFALATKLALEVGYVLTPEPGFDDDDGDLNPSAPIQAAGVGRAQLREAVLEIVSGALNSAIPEPWDIASNTTDRILALLPQPDQSTSTAKREITELDARREQMRRIFIRDGVGVPQEQAWAVHRATDDELAAIISPSPVAAPAGWREDDPALDGTDLAHSAYWRGQDAAVEGLCGQLEAILDGAPVEGAKACARLQTLRERLGSIVASASPWKATHRHKKRGTLYRITGVASLQTDTPVEDETYLFVYQDQQGLLWARPMEEFHDGRFEHLSASPPLPASGEGVEKDLGRLGVEETPSRGSESDREPSTGGADQ